MNKPHKHADLIKAWADGAEIQYDIGRGWSDYVGVHTAPSWNDLYIKFRIKPETIRYRNFLWRTASGLIVVAVTNEQDDYREPRINWGGFIKWLGDWVEVEV